MSGHMSRRILRSPEGEGRMEGRHFDTQRIDTSETEVGKKEDRPEGKNWRHFLRR